MTLSRDRRRGKKKYFRTHNQIKTWSDGKCPNCGEKGPHFAPPGFGTPGFFMCDKKAA